MTSNTCISGWSSLSSELLSSSENAISFFFLIPSFCLVFFKFDCTSHFFEFLKHFVTEVSVSGRLSGHGAATSVLALCDLHCKLKKIYMMSETFICTGLPPVPSCQSSWQSSCHSSCPCSCQSGCLCSCPSGLVGCHSWHTSNVIITVLPFKTFLLPYFHSFHL